MTEICPSCQEWLVIRLVEYLKKNKNKTFSFCIAKGICHVCVIEYKSGIDDLV